MAKPRICDNGRIIVSRFQPNSTGRDAVPTFDLWYQRIPVMNVRRRGLGVMS